MRDLIISGGLIPEIALLFLLNEVTKIGKWAFLCDLKELGSLHFSKAIFRNMSSRSSHLRKAPYAFRAGTALQASLVRVPIKSIRIPPADRLDGNRTKHLSGLIISQDLAAIVQMTHPPVLVCDALNADMYLVLANASTVQWIRESVHSDASQSDDVLSVMLEGSSFTNEQLQAIAHRLAPFVLDQLSARDKRHARRALKQAGLPLPHERSLREQMAHLRAR